MHPNTSGVFEARTVKKLKAHTGNMIDQICALKNLAGKSDTNKRTNCMRERYESTDIYAASHGN